MADNETEELMDGEVKFPDQDSALPGIVFGLLNSIEDDKPKPPPTESAIVKTMAMVLEKIARPFIYLFYWNEHIPLSYGRMRQIWIIAVMLVIPLILFCMNYFHISKKIKEFNDTKPSPPNRQDVTMIYMTCIWMSMFVLFVVFFPRLQHMAK
jgi:hypothetical protein